MSNEDIDEAIEEFNFFNEGDYITRKMEIAKDIVLTAYEKEKEKNKELEKDIDDWKFTAKYVEDNYISKDKIKAKIEEYKKRVEQMEKDDIGIGFTLGKEWSDLKAKIEFGQSLLDKE